MSQSDHEWLEAKMTELQKSERRVKQLQYLDDSNTRLIARQQIAYIGIIDAHARLMIQTMTRNVIREVLAGEYAFDLCQDAHTDLRDELNALFAERAEDNKRMLMEQS